MKKFLSLFAALILAVGLCGVSFAQQAVPLSALDFTIVGVGIGASPEYQAVPKGITSQVLTSLSVGDADVSEIIKPCRRTTPSGPSFPARPLPRRSGS